MCTLIIMNEKKTEEIKQTRRAGCSKSGNPKDKWCRKSTWYHCGAKSLPEEIGGVHNTLMSAVEHIGALRSKERRNHLS